ncbi:hypothetical protein P22_3704 [Propionispora sp. 2/2-37]|uniref:methyl-accepting chemotaxis protein n=1 Tax=Propionispora sp. 2/2-37 TaxID=1677858 RepID=UPI0006BB684D|nr:methyl-accepting chemotaxis protein [Propionispora sp. 2/2-37]CUH97573.1 hypothetical protein P22_3704 [Propionispora sp. 2/2-37]
MKIKNIQTRLLIILLPLVLIALSVLAGVSYYLARSALNKSVDQMAMAVGTDYAGRIQADIRLRLAQLDDLASMQQIHSADSAQITAALTETQKRLGNFDLIFFVAPDGAGLTSAGTAAGYGERDYFKKVMTTRQAVVSDPLVSKATGKLAVVLAVPVIANGQVTGMIGGTFSMERLSDMMKDLKFLDTGYGQLADDQGMIIAHPKRPEMAGKLNLLEKKINPELKLQQTDLDERLTKLFKTAVDSGVQTQGTYTFIDNVPRTALATPFDLPGGQRWVMTVSAPESEAAQAVSSLARAMLIISLVCLVLAALAIIYIAKYFAQPIAAIRDECLLLAGGDLRERESKVVSEDEIGQLARGFRDMRQGLRALVARVHDQAEHLAASSEELTASAGQSAQAVNQVAASITDVAAGAGEQATAANETTAVVERMSSNIQHVASTATMVAEQSKQAAAKADAGSRSVNKAVDQMVQVEQTVNTSAQVVTELGERSKEIGQIVATISGIAGQTNLLALNAAIEAARAGEQGRGFAVVAEEVRKLAEQSQQATEQISALIGGIQVETEKAVLAMDDGTKEVRLGAEIVNAAGQAFQEIVDLVNRVSDQVQEMSSAVEQLAAGSELIVESVNQIDDLSKKAAAEAQTVSAASEEQSASMEEIASSSQSLAKLAMELREAVSKFHI